MWPVAFTDESYSRRFEKGGTYERTISRELLDIKQLEPGKYRYFFHAAFPEVSRVHTYYSDPFFVLDEGLILD